MPEGPELPDNHHVNTTSIVHPTPKPHILTHTTTNNLILFSTPKHTISDECIQEWIGDGLCEDENNVPECDYDGGDCCGIVDKKHCKECKCKDPSFGGTVDKQPCFNSKLRGDGNCDDENNNPECDFDGGDCCTDTRHLQCHDCICKDQNHSNFGVFGVKRIIMKTENTKDCPKSFWIGDGHCDDENNIPECNFDGGDCCIDTEQKHCQKCECIQ